MATPAASAQTSSQTEVGPDFWCDAGLGGLARWLRAAGYDAAWDPQIDDGVLLQKGLKSGAIVLTNDSGVMERRLVTRKEVKALLLPPVGTIQDQLSTVVKKFALTRREPRCMQCGGKLEPKPKEALKERIPPKTFLWLNEFFLCSRCDKLFWRGSHWQRIGTALDAIFSDFSTM
jgi:uncharacterized protein with PIN domain